LNTRICPDELCLVEEGCADDCFEQISSREIRLEQIHRDEICFGEIDLAELRALELCSSQLHTAKRRPGEVYLLARVLFPPRIPRLSSSFKMASCSELPKNSVAV
jgi:hypothetical protein